MVAFLLERPNEDEPALLEEERWTVLRRVRRCILPGDSLLLSAWMVRMGAMRPRANAGE